MIDLHSHILPGVDDGAASLEVALQMAQMWVDDGVSVVACTPHILPGLYANSGPDIRVAVQALQTVLDERGLPLRLVTGADNHITHDFVGGLRRGHLLPLADSRYVLIEPPHHVLPPRLDALFFNLVMAGYVPILTHPERLSWVEGHYGLMKQLVAGGVWMQVTAGSLTGKFGRKVQHLAEKMLDEGLVHVLASDAHDPYKRFPNMGEGFARAQRLVGDDEAKSLVFTRPQGILDNAAPDTLSKPLGAKSDAINQGVDQAGQVSSEDQAADATGAGQRRGIARRLWGVFGH